MKTIAEIRNHLRLMEKKKELQDELSLACEDTLKLIDDKNNKDVFVETFSKAKEFFDFPGYTFVDVFDKKSKPIEDLFKALKPDFELNYSLDSGRSFEKLNEKDYTSVLSKVLSIDESELHGVSFDLFYSETLLKVMDDDGNAVFKPFYDVVKTWMFLDKALIANFSDFYCLIDVKSDGGYTIHSLNEANNYCCWIDDLFFYSNFRD